MTFKMRIVRFVLVGTLCFFAQWGAMQILQLFMHIFIAGMIAFTLSAQLNFISSRAVTWTDRTGNPLLRNWIDFNIVVIICSGFNAGMICLLMYWNLPQWLALIIALPPTSAISFVMYNFYVFREDRSEQLTEPGVLRPGV
ncbi:GtrA family protein [Candidatus Saccharibacteria bacterium]|nr:GtrA family protein [Candidatus Saccharibacteria bacterium]